MKPGSFDKVAIPEVKEIIEGCIRQNKDERSLSIHKAMAQLKSTPVLLLTAHSSPLPQVFDKGPPEPCLLPRGDGGACGAGGGG